MPREYVNARWAGSSEPAPNTAVIQWHRDRSLVAIGVQAAQNDDRGFRPQMHLDLDRDGVNNLIRLLRRARDAAFGADA